MVSTAAKRQVVQHLMDQHDLSQRRACEVNGIARSSVRYQAQGRPGDIQMTELLHTYAERYP